MRSRMRLFTALMGLLLTVGTTGAWAQVREQVRTSRDQYIPDRLLERAYAIAVIPDMTKIAFFAGGRRGHGVLVVRDKDGRFTSPVFITMTGGSGACNQLTSCSSSPPARAWKASPAASSRWAPTPPSQRARSVVRRQLQLTRASRLRCIPTPAAAAYSPA